MEQECSNVLWNINDDIKATSFRVLNYWQINLATALGGGCPKAQSVMTSVYEKKDYVIILYLYTMTLFLTSLNTYEL